MTHFWGSRRNRGATAALALIAALALVVGCGSTSDADGGNGATSAGSAATEQPAGTDAGTANGTGGTNAANAGGEDAAPGDTATPDQPAASADDGTPATDDAADPSAATGGDSGTADAPAEPTYPVTVTTSGGELTISAQPTAIVSLSPTATEMLYAIGAGDQVVAVDKNSNYPEQGLPANTVDGYEVNVEAISQFHPDLVISSYLSDEQIAQFGKLSIPVLMQPAVADLDGTYEQIEQLGTITGHASSANAVVTTMKDEIADIVAQAPTFAPEATYYYELDQTYYSQTSETFLGSLMGMHHLDNIADAAEGAAEAGGYPQLSAEFILKSDPDYIFLSDVKCCDQSAATVAERPGWSTLQAVKGDRVVELDDDIASRWGPRVVDLLRTVVTALTEHPAQR